LTEAPAEGTGESPGTKLRNRKVVQWGLGYAAAAWTLLQVIEYFGETYSWPPAVRQIAAIALPLGTLFVLVVAWYHGDKGAQRVSRPEAVILAVLVIGVGAALWTYVSRLDESAWEPADGLPNIKHVVPKDAASVAVLPFVDMSEAKDQEYFSDGLSDEILNALTRIPHLYVPARTSSFQFKGKSGDVAAFAERLGVATVLEGSVRRSGQRVRISAQLVRAPDGYHLWSETYDRELRDIFAVQEEIASAIADALKLQLTEQEKLAAARTRPTANLDAYEAYLVGRFDLNQRGDHVQKSVPHFEKAVALDPKFAVAWADLAVAQCLISIYGTPGERPATIAKARASVEKAVALDPERAEVLAATGFVEWTDGRPAVGIEFVNRSLALRPNSGEALAWRRNLLVALGRYDQVLAASYESVKRDPLSWLALFNHAGLLLELGRTAEIGPVLEQLRELGHDERAEWILERQAGIEVDRPEQIRRCILRTELTGGEGCDDASAFASLGLRTEAARIGPPWLVHSLFGEYDKALPLVRKEYANGATLRLNLIGTLTRNQRHEEAVELLEEQFPEPPMLGWEETGVGLMSGAFAARAAGHAETAKRYRDGSVGWLVAAERAGFVTFGGRALAKAMLNAYDGNDDEAAKAAIITIRTDPNMWMVMPHIWEMKDIVVRPDVQAAMREQEALVARQRREVVEMLCGPDPVSKKYEPLPETCALMKSSR
jgi:TolB-like protein